MSEDKDCYIESNQMILNKKEVTCNKMRKALVAIAQEVLLFQESNNIASTPSLTSNDDILNKLIKTKSSLAFKRKSIEKLKEKVRTACSVAHAAITDGENENTSLNGHLHLARSEYKDLYQKHRQTSEIILNLTKDNQLLRDQLEKLFSFIKLGYNELQKINSECSAETSVTQQLKRIIVCCGQYYADFNNEREKNSQLCQRNRFLNNKINILNNNLEAITEDLKNLRRQNERFQKESCSHKESIMKLKRNYVVSIPSEFHKNYQQKYINNTTRTKIDLIRKPLEFDVTVHLSIIKNLLRDQDDLLKDLKSLSEEIVSDEITI